MKCVFISGPLTKGDLCDNLNRATAAFVELAKAGFWPFCPHLSAYCKPAVRQTCPLEDDAPPYLGVVCEATTDGHPSMTYAEWLNIDLAWVERSDAVLRLPGESAGADLETAHADRFCIPVFHTIAELLAWAKPSSPHGA